MSSIRLPIISPILLQGISEASTDMSPYVRKTAAHAIPKLASIDPSTREQLIEIISRLLGDRAPLVAGSAVLAYLRVCPDRVDLLHKNYRKLCQMLIDVDEWGQLRFAKTRKYATIKQCHLGFSKYSLVTRELNSLRPKRANLTLIINFF